MNDPYMMPKLYTNYFQFVIFFMDGRTDGRAGERTGAGGRVEHLWNIFEALLEHLRNTYGTLLEHFWDTFRTLLEHVNASILLERAMNSNFYF